MTSIRNSGQLRQFLVDTMQELKAGKVRVETASQITKMAAQVNESIYSEVKVARTQKEMGALPVPMGSLGLGETGK